MKKFLGVWLDVMERQKVKVSGLYYNGCSYENTFDSGLSNPGNKREYMQDIDYPAGPSRTSRSGEVTTSALLSDFSGTPYTLTYTH